MVIFICYRRFQMCGRRHSHSDFISQKMAFFIVTDVKNLKSYIALTDWSL
jgi:hypothetical protein